MTVALASDHVGLPLKRAILAHLEERGVACRDFGTNSDARCDYPQFALPAAKAVADGEYTCGILCCGTGIGMSIAANKVAGIRCTACSDRLTRRRSPERTTTRTCSPSAAAWSVRGSPCKS